jgi:hypothetical protein
VNADRDELTAALDHNRQYWDSEERRDIITDLMPVVEKIAARRSRKYAAQVLRAAAQEQRNEAGQVPDTDEGTHADGHRCAGDFLDRRADALDPT